MTEEDPLLLAKAMLTSESKVEDAFRISMMPWLTFTGVTWLFLYCYAHLPSFVVISLSTWATMCLCTLLAMYLRPKAPAAQGKHGLVVVLSALVSKNSLERSFSVKKRQNMELTA
ncbi:Uncharacterized protein SCF082_LOCUS10419 [Durusdinium trenchii]|uniref:Uncharacterized protein n=1 Tax=Durusdinium trenchii TaxID=1381693 RepID=A0ABP0J615_9DINO